jgi:hypothetical protein
MSKNFTKRLEEELEHTVDYLRERYGLDNVIIFAGNTFEDTKETYKYSSERGSALANRQIAEDYVNELADGYYDEKFELNNNEGEDKDGQI